MGLEASGLVQDVPGYNIQSTLRMEENQNMGCGKQIRLTCNRVQCVYEIAAVEDNGMTMHLTLSDADGIACPRNAILKLDSDWGSRFECDQENFLFAQGIWYTAPGGISMSD